MLLTIDPCGEHPKPRLRGRALFYLVGRERVHPRVCAHLVKLRAEHGILLDGSPAVMSSQPR